MLFNEQLNLPPELARLDSEDRGRWAVAAAHSLITQIDTTTLATIVAAGEDEFVRVSRRKYHGQSFRTEDLRQIFAILKWKLGYTPRRPVMIHG